MLDTYKMVIIAFSVMDKANRVRFFEKTFLMANVSPEVVFGMLLLTLSDADVDFSRQELRWRTYTTKKAFQTTRYVKLVGKKEFVAAALNLEHKTYIVHIVSLSSTPSVASPRFIPFNVHSFRRPQISGLIDKKAFTKVLNKYTDFTDVFSSNLASELPKHTGINDRAIKPIDG